MLDNLLCPVGRTIVDNNHFKIRSIDALIVYTVKTSPDSRLSVINGNNYR